MENPKLLEQMHDFLADVRTRGPDTFGILFGEGVRQLGLSDPAVAELFSVSRTNAERWQRLESKPAMGYQKMVIKTMTSMLETSA